VSIVADHGMIGAEKLADLKACGFPHIPAIHKRTDPHAPELEFDAGHSHHVEEGCGVGAAAL
jgi:hypothetical protein